MRPRRVLQALPNRPNGQRHKSPGHQSIGQRGALNRDAVVQCAKRADYAPGRLHHVDCGWVTLTVPVCTCDDSTCYALPLAYDFADNSSFKSYVIDSRWGRGTLRMRKQRGVVGVTPPPTQEPGRCLGVSSSRIQENRVPDYSRARLLCVMNIAPCPGVFLTHSAAQAVHALRSGRPRAQGGWVKGSCLVREAVPTDRRHAALKQRTTDRLRGTDDER